MHLQIAPPARAVPVLDGSSPARVRLTEQAVPAPLLFLDTPVEEFKQVGLV